jgi:hypothetical protein
VPRAQLPETVTISLQGRIPLPLLKLRPLNCYAEQAVNFAIKREEVVIRSSHLRRNNPLPSAVGLNETMAMFSQPHSYPLKLIGYALSVDKITLPKESATKGKRS